MSLFNPKPEPDRFKDQAPIRLLKSVQEFGDWMDRGGFLTRESIDTKLKSGQWSPYNCPQQFPCFVFTNVRTKMPTFIYLDDLAEGMQILTMLDDVKP